MADFHYETQRLILRDWRDADWAPFWEGTNTAAVMQYLGGIADAPTRIAVRDRLERYARDFGHTFWPVERKADGAILGFCGLKRCTDKNGPFGMMEAGWRLREDAWGHGYAREAATATLDLAFERFRASEAIAITVMANTGSRTLMQRLGMTRRPQLDFDGAAWAKDHGKVIVHAITRAAWNAHRAGFDG